MTTRLIEAAKELTRYLWKVQDWGGTYIETCIDNVDEAISDAEQQAADEKSELERLRAYRDDMHKLVEGVDVACLRGENERLQQQVAELTKACEQYQEHGREMTTACARLRGENELRQEAAVVAMEEREELRNALQELLEFSLPIQSDMYALSSEQAREKAENLLRQHTATE